MTHKEMQILLTLLIDKKVLIIVPTEAEARSYLDGMADYIRTYRHAFYRGLISAGNTLHIKGGEYLEAATPEYWQKHRHYLFEGLVLVEDSMGADIYIPMISKSPELLHAYLGGVKL